jgi:hypothetical protein
MYKTELKPGWIVQLHPEITKNPMFRGCFMVVDEPKPWGAQGYVQALGEKGESGGQAYYRATWAEMEPTGGIAPWTIGDPSNG